MSLVANLLGLMDEPTQAEFLAALEFLKTRTGSARKHILAALKKGGEEECCYRINYAQPKMMDSLCFLFALEENWEWCYRTTYYAYGSLAYDEEEVAPIQPATSPELYWERHRNFIKEAAPYENTEKHCLWCKYHLSAHDTKTYLARGLDRCFGDRVPSPTEIWNFNIDPMDPSCASDAFQGGLILINLKQFDLARWYIDTLRGYSGMSHSRWRRQAYHPKYYRAAIDFLDRLFEARKADDQEEARRWAARAIAANLRMVADCFDSPGGDAAGSFWVDGPYLALCTAIEFDFDAEWGQNCCRAMLHLLEDYPFHGIIPMVTATNSWMWTHEKYGLLPLEKAAEISTKAWRAK